VRLVVVLASNAGGVPGVDRKLCLTASSLLLAPPSEFGINPARSNDVRLVFLASLVAAVLLLPATRLDAQAQNQPVADLEAAAEAGNRQAQDKLGDFLYYRGDSEHAVPWYRLAAAQGVPNSQYRLSEILFFRARSLPPSKADTSAAYSDEAVSLLIKAAAQGHKRAQLELGHSYEAGKYLSRDLPEAYKWYCLAAQGLLSDADANMAKSNRDSLVLKLDREQLAEGNRRLSDFLVNPDKPPAVPEPAHLAQLKLQGITGTQGHELAIINGKTLATNETANITIDGRSVSLRCLKISPNSATVSIEGFPVPEKLNLR
jgi:hypothetical protein